VSDIGLDGVKPAGMIADPPAPAAKVAPAIAAAAAKTVREWEAKQEAAKKAAAEADKRKRQAAIDKSWADVTDDVNRQMRGR
jgi:hypothetical protein